MQRCCRSDVSLSNLIALLFVALVAIVKPVVSWICLSDVLSLRGKVCRVNFCTPTRYTPSTQVFRAEAHSSLVKIHHDHLEGLSNLGSRIELDSEQVNPPGQWVGCISGPVWSGAGSGY
jgi:hypothetical protein